MCATKMGMAPTVKADNKTCSRLGPPTMAKARREGLADLAWHTVYAVFRQRSCGQLMQLITTLQTSEFWRVPSFSRKTAAGLGVWEDLSMWRFPSFAVIVLASWHMIFHGGYRRSCFQNFMFIDIWIWLCNVKTNLEYPHVHPSLSPSVPPSSICSVYAILVHGSQHFLIGPIVSMLLLDPRTRSKSWLAPKIWKVLDIARFRNRISGHNLSHEWKLVSGD